MNKIFGYAAVVNGEQVAVAITKTGTTLVIISCAPEQAEIKLGMAQGSTENHSRYKAHFRGEAWSTEFIDGAQIEGHLGLQRAFKKENKRQDDKFEAVRQRLANKNPNQAERRKQKFGVSVVDVADE